MYLVYTIQHETYNTEKYNTINITQKKTQKNAVAEKGRGDCEHVESTVTE